MALAEQRDQHQFDRLALADDHPLDVGDDPIGDLFDRLHSVASSLSFRTNTLRQYTTSPNYESNYICQAYLCHNARCSTMIESYNPGTCIQISFPREGGLSCGGCSSLSSLPCSWRPAAQPIAARRRPPQPLAHQRRRHL